MNPKSASAKQSWDPVSIPALHTAPAPIVPNAGPPNAMRASSYAFLGCFFAAIAAPMKGIKTMGENGIFSFRMTRAWPDSWTRMRPTMPEAKGRPYIVV